MIIKEDDCERLVNNFLDISIQINSVAEHVEENTLELDSFRDSEAEYAYSEIQSI